jgi:hypothetical protein
MKLAVKVNCKSRARGLGHKRFEQGSVSLQIKELASECSYPGRFIALR